MAWAAAIAPLAGAVAVERRGRTDRTEKDASLALFDSARAKLAVQTTWARGSGTAGWEAGCNDLWRRGAREQALVC